MGVRAISGREAVRESSGREWDHVWIGANIATMAAGPTAYGSIENAALAVAGERIAWIGPAEEAQALAAAQGVPTHDVRGLWMTPVLI